MVKQLNATYPRLKFSSLYLYSQQANATSSSTFFLSSWKEIETYLPIL